MSFSLALILILLYSLCAHLSELGKDRIQRLWVPKTLVYKISWFQGYHFIDSLSGHLGMAAQTSTQQSNVKKHISSHLTLKEL